MTYANGRMTSAAAECALQRSAALTATSKQLLSGSYSDPPHTTFTSSDSFQADGQAASTRTLLILHSHSDPHTTFTDSFQADGLAAPTWTLLILHSLTTQF